MTTLTIDKIPFELKETHFSSMEELLKLYENYKFEKELEASYKKAKNAKIEDFVNL
ncbi:MAG: hypothetical protein PHG82_04310 [Candidatus Gracilibacteria bacterium]|nr:hypothetical protein [Candidatus Gracilibacteria bacterium]